MSNTIGELITELRSRNRMSQKDLADFLYVNQGTVSRWERGIRFPDTELIIKMAEQFGVDPAVMLKAPFNRADTPEILLVEDELVMLDDCYRTLSEALPAASVHPFRWASDALQFAKSCRVDVAFLDIELQGSSGLDLAKELTSLNPFVNIIFLTGHPEYAGEALDLFCSGYILKPLNKNKIRNQISHLRHSVSGLSV